MQPKICYASSPFCIKYRTCQLRMLWQLICDNLWNLTITEINVSRCMFDWAVCWTDKTEKPGFSSVDGLIAVMLAWCVLVMLHRGISSARWRGTDLLSLRWLYITWFKHPPWFWLMIAFSTCNSNLCLCLRDNVAQVHVNLCSRGFFGGLPARRRNQTVDPEMDSSTFWPTELMLRHFGSSVFDGGTPFYFFWFVYRCWLLNTQPLLTYLNFFTTVGCHGVQPPPPSYQSSHHPAPVIPEYCKPVKFFDKPLRLYWEL